MICTSIAARSRTEFETTRRRFPALIHAVLAALATAGVSITAPSTALAKDTLYASEDEWSYYEGFCYWHDEWADTTPTLDARPNINYPGYVSRPVPDVDCWLTWAHPEIADAIKWQTDPATKLAYANWSPQQKADLAASVAAYWNWYESGYPLGVVDPRPMSSTTANPYPVNLATDGSTVISADDAWNYFIDSIGLTLAAQLGHWFTWDLRTDSHMYLSDLRYLLDSEEMFSANIWVGDGLPWTYRVIAQEVRSDFPVHGAATLTSPLQQLRFLAANGLVRGSSSDTLFAALDWGRDHLIHFSGAPYDTSVEQAVWQYSGQPPVQKVIDGTQSRQSGDAGGTQHWTMGCHGTSGFYKSVLRTVNIPLRVDRNLHSGMAFPMGPWAVAGHITHSDSLYSQIFRDQHLGLPGENVTSTPTSTANLVIDDADYQGLFDPSLHSGEERAANVGISELRYFSTSQPVPTSSAMKTYCSDLARRVPHNQSGIWALFTPFGVPPTGMTLQSVESSGLWTKLERRRTSYPGGCSAFNR